MVGDLMGLATTTSLDENRYIKGYDQLSLPRKVALYLKNFDSKFWGREYLVKSYILLKRDVLGVSPLPEKVVLGKEEWLYLADYGAMDDYRNVRPFSKVQLDSIQSNLRYLSKSLAENGIKLYVAVVPDKHTIYPDYLPTNVKKIRAESRLQQLNARLGGENEFEFINLTDTLLASRKFGFLYFREESHWNDLGAFIGYQKIMRIIKQDFPTIQPLTMDSCRTYSGFEKDLDLAKLLGANPNLTESTYRITPVNSEHIYRAETGVDIPPAKRFNPFYAFRKVNPWSSSPACVVYRDSFFDAVTPFWEQTFSQSTFVWTNDVDLRYVKSQPVRLVLIEIAERHIDLLSN